MNQSQTKTNRYVAAGVCILTVLVLLYWYALRQPRAPVEKQPAVSVAETSRVRHVEPRFAPAVDEEQPETPEPEVTASPVTNAAVLYRQAFALCDSLTEDEKNLLRDWRTNVAASVEAELCEKIRPICELMHEAATVTNCEWDIERPITFETRWPHMLSGTDVIRAATWSAAHCHTDDPVGTVDDLVAVSRLGRHLSSPTVFPYMIDLQIQEKVVRFVAEHAGTLAETGDTRLLQLFDDTHYYEGLSRAFDQEADENSREADKLATMPPDEAMEELRFIFSRTDIGPRLDSMDLGQAISSIRQTAELQREWAKALLLPEAEYRKWLAQLQTARSTDAFVEDFLSGVEASTRTTQRATISAAMLVAGLAVVRDGPNALLSHPDPATSRPFNYVQTGDGFELGSGYHLPNGQPLKLRFK